MTPEFKDAKLYTCTDGEYITNTDWAEAILEKLEGDWEEGETIAEQCERIGPITVDAYKPTPISPEWVSSEVGIMMERFEDNFNEAYGSNDHEADPWPTDAREWIRKVLTANLTKSLRSATTHACEQIGSHTFSVAECVEMLK